MVRHSHGGSLARGRRKAKRPLVARLPVHLVLRARQARGFWSLLHSRNAWRVEVLFADLAPRHRVRVHRFANVGNHIHAVVSARTREGFQNFLRHFAGTLALQVTRSNRHRKLRRRFWDELAFTRVVEDWDGAFTRVVNYTILNVLEGLGLKRRDLLVADLGPLKPD